MTVRRAAPSDREAAVALWTALHREHEAQDARYRLADDAAARWATDLRDWTRSDADRVWIAFEDEAQPAGAQPAGAQPAGAQPAGAPVGLLTAHLYVPAPTFAPARMVYVDDLYVAPEARGRGLAGELLNEARAWALASGAGEIRAGVLASNPAARAFWQRQGGVDYSIVVTLRPGGD